MTLARLHGDLHPANVLTTDSTICGAIDFGDPTFDLAAAWPLLLAGTTDRLHDAYQPTS